jgi:hypothetical protein
MNDRPIMLLLCSLIAIGLPAEILALEEHLTVSVSQYNETNVMHFSFILFRIKGLYMFRALLAHPHEALHIRHLVYCVRIMSVGCGKVAQYVSYATPILLFFVYYHLDGIL